MHSYTHAFVLSSALFRKQTKQANETIQNVSGNIIECPAALKLSFLYAIHTSIDSLMVTGLWSYYDQFRLHASYLVIAHKNAMSCMNKWSNAILHERKETTEMNYFLFQAHFVCYLHLNVFPLFNSVQSNTFNSIWPQTF